MDRKTKKILCRALSICLIGGTFLGFTGAPAAQAYKGELEDIALNTRAVRQVAPDMAYIHFSVQGSGSTSEEAVQQVASKTAQIKRSLLGSNLTRDDYYQVRFNVSPRYDSKGKINGYQASNTMKVKVDVLSKIGTVIDKLAAGGVDNINNIEYSLSKREQVWNQLLAEAVASARRQAEAVAQSDGRKVGRLLTARINSYGGVMSAMDGVASGSMAKNLASQTVIQPVQLEVSANVDVTFALE